MLTRRILSPFGEEKRRGRAGSKGHERKPSAPMGQLIRARAPSSLQSLFPFFSCQIKDFISYFCLEIKMSRSDGFMALLSFSSPQSFICPRPPASPSFLFSFLLISHFILFYISFIIWRVPPRCQTFSSSLCHSFSFLLERFRRPCPLLFSFYRLSF